MFSAASVCLFVNTITIKRSMTKVGGQVHSTEISLEFECQGQRLRSPGTKNALSAADTPGCVRMICARCKQRPAAADGPISWLPGGVFGACVQCMFGESLAL